MTCNTFHLWHLHLGHPSRAKLSLLNKSVPDVHVNKEHCCDIYHLSKQKRLPFPFSVHVFLPPFELIHVDLWGPFSIPTVEGHKYFLAIVDDFSKCAWVYLLKTKSETQFLIPQFSTMV